MISKFFFKRTEMETACISNTLLLINKKAVNFKNNFKKNRKHR